ncbi:MAG: hypothetical protein GY811_29715 [Myxococcales bacterium]|nr:hypothetical protein [Myxococcales bacterium]
MALAPVAGCFHNDDPAEDNTDGGIGGECIQADDCGAAFVCAGGFCQLAGSVGLGGSCWSTVDCGEEFFCSPIGICAPTGSGEEGDVCATAAECERGLSCEVFGFGGQCASSGEADIGDACVGNGDCAAGLACGPEDTCGHPSVVYPPFTGVECAEDEAGFKAYFEVPGGAEPLSDFYRLPFPNDVRVSETGALDMSDFPRPGQNILGVDLVDLYVDALVEDFEGFSGVAAVSMRFSKELDFSSVSGDSLHYIDITPGSAEYGNERQRSWGYSTSARLYHCQHFFNITTAAHEPLLPGHTYAVYLTTDVSAADGTAIVQDADFAEMLASARPTDAALGVAWDAYAPFREYLADASEGVDSATVAVAAVFTVQETTARGEALAQATEASAAPVLSDLTLCDGTNVSPCEDATGRGACSAPNDDFFEIHGRYSVPIYQEGTAPYETPEDGGGINFVGGVPQQEGSESVCFALTIPKTAMPAGGWPFNVFGHGTGGAFTGAVQSGVAAALATSAQPMAMFSFDGVVHGERRKDSTRDSDSLMFNVINPRAARDNNLQGAVDVVQALRIPGIGEVTLPGSGVTRFDATRTFFTGHSQGSNVGIPAIAGSDLASAALLSGAGAHLTRGILTKTSPVNAKASLEFTLGEDLGTSHPVMVVWQTFFDSVDTLHYAPLLVKRPPTGLASKHIYMSWGEDDTFSPQPTLKVMARAIGLPVADPVIEDLGSGLTSRPVSLNVTGGDGAERTAACFQYPAEGSDGHFAALRNAQAVSDWLAFYASAIATGTPTVGTIP